jgi:hypothetical protein
MQDDEFRAQTTNFLSWLSEVGVKMNPKMDLREMQLNGLRCRGICKTSFPLLDNFFALPMTMYGDDISMC